MSQRNWLCTRNNPDSHEEYLKGIHEKTGATYTCGQLERGLGGTLHLQFFLNFTQKARITKITKVDLKSIASLL